MGILDFFYKNDPHNDLDVIKKQPINFDDELSKEMEINPNKQLPEYKTLPPVIFGNG